MEFGLRGFADSIKKNLYDNFPYEKNDIKDKKHVKTPFHIRDIAFMDLPTYENNGTIMFEIGSEYAEENYPYYHILEDAQVIRKKGKSNKSSRGSQASIEQVSKRDYGHINFNGKTYSREYRKNVRGSRSRLGTATKVVVGSDGKAYRVNPNANYYVNKHYQYIERALNMVLPWIAQEYGMRMGRTELTDLSEEYTTQENESRIMNIMSSFED